MKIINKDNIFLLIGILLIIISIILNEIIEINEFITIGLKFCALIFFNIYLVKFYKNK